VLDEPFSGLDPWARAELAELLVTLSTKNHFLLISTHDAPLKLREHVRETWIIANQQLTVHPGCSIPE
jgi:ABC-type Mn2+/Zn2+ transport system ATPase subunit